MNRKSNNNKNLAPSGPMEYGLRLSSESKNQKRKFVAHPQWGSGIAFSVSSFYYLRFMFFRLIFIAGLIIPAFCLKAQTFTQEINASGGGYYKQINGSLQFSIGEPLIETYKSSSATLYQGFEQGSYSIVSVSEINPDSTIIVTLFPNPTSDFVNVSVAASTNADFKIRIYDLTGNELLTSSLSAHETRKINLSQFPSAIFYIAIYNNENTYQKTFKITKVK